MDNILSNYEITEMTMALVPKFHTEYRTLAIETGGKMIYIEKTPLELIEHACIQGWSTLTGRRKAILKRTGFSHKVPILLDEAKEIITFPSKSPKSDKCSWIFYHHVSFVQKISKQRNNKEYLTTIVFKDGQTLEMKESSYILERQLFRSYKFTKMLVQ
ncbi:competence protein ComK [Radiobacillus deserti]|nr:competence protein ComK [Radiobacillus deserti]